MCIISGWKELKTTINQNTLNIIKSQKQNYINLKKNKGILIIKNNIKPKITIVR